jgi:mRNA degradation ribonuclease J1/J2
MNNNNNQNQPHGFSQIFPFRYKIKNQIFILFLFHGTGGNEKEDLIHLVRELPPEYAILCHKFGGRDRS